MSFREYVSQYVRTKRPGLSEPHLNFLTNCLTTPRVLATSKLSSEQKLVANKLFEALRSSLNLKAEAYPTTPEGIAKFFTNGNQFLAREYQKRASTSQPTTKQLAVQQPLAPPAASSISRTHSQPRSVAAVDDLPLQQRRSATSADSRRPLSSSALPRVDSRRRPRARVLSEESINDVDNLSILPIASAEAQRHRQMVPYNDPHQVPYDDSDSSDSLSDCDDNVFEESKWVCRYVYKKDVGIKKKGHMCGRAYHSPKYLCADCGRCSGLHVMSGHQIITRNPCHCSCMSKKYCGGHGGRKRCGLPCDARVRGGGRCLRHQHVRNVARKKKRRRER